METFYLSESYIKETDKRFGLFDHSLENVLDAAAMIRKDAELTWYTAGLYEALKNHTTSEIDIPECEESEKGRNFAPLIAMLPFIENADKIMRERKLPPDIIAKAHKQYEYVVDIHVTRFGFPAVNNTYFHWSQHYLNADLLRIGEFNFEIRKCFDMEFGELKPDDPVINVHIPRGAKIAPEYRKASFKRAIEIFDTYYPDFNPKAFVCFSWLLDPYLKECLGDSSNIVTFQSYFDRFPTHSDGKEVFSFVFIKPFNSYEELPENTTLERKLKELYLSGGAVHAYGGVHMIDGERNA